MDTGKNDLNSKQTEHLPQMNSYPDDVMILKTKEGAEFWFSELRKNISKCQELSCSLEFELRQAQRALEKFPNSPASQPHQNLQTKIVY